MHFRMLRCCTSCRCRGAKPSLFTFDAVASTSRQSLPTSAVSSSMSSSGKYCFNTSRILCNNGDNDCRHNAVTSSSNEESTAFRCDSFNVSPELMPYNNIDDITSVFISSTNIIAISISIAIPIAIPIAIAIVIPNCPHPFHFSNFTGPLPQTHSDIEDLLPNSSFSFNNRTSLGDMFRIRMCRNVCVAQTTQTHIFVELRAMMSAIFGVVKTRLTTNSALANHPMRT